MDEGKLKNLLMSRRPGPDFEKSNGHGRSSFLSDAKPVMSNLFFSSTESLSKEDLKKKFLDSCRAEKLEYCIVVRQMDNPSLSLLHQEDFSELLASFGGNAATDRLPLVVYKIYPPDGHEEIVRGGLRHGAERLAGFHCRSLAAVRGGRSARRAWRTQALAAAPRASHERQGRAVTFSARITQMRQGWSVRTVSFYRSEVFPWNPIAARFLLD